MPGGALQYFSLPNIFSFHTGSRGSNESWSYFETNWYHTFTIINHQKTFYTQLDLYLNYKKPLVDGVVSLRIDLTSFCHFLDRAI